MGILMGSIAPYSLQGFCLGHLWTHCMYGFDSPLIWAESIVTELNVNFIGINQCESVRGWKW